MIPLTDIPEENPSRKWYVKMQEIINNANAEKRYNLQSKPHFKEEVYGHLMLELKIEWKPVKHALSALTRINQKVLDSSKYRNLNNCTDWSKALSNGKNWRSLFG